jgi:hypothetical protein
MFCDHHVANHLLDMNEIEVSLDGKTFNPEAVSFVKNCVNLLNHLQKEMGSNFQAFLFEAFKNLSESYFAREAQRETINQARLLKKYNDAKNTGNMSWINKGQDTSVLLSGEFLNHFRFELYFHTKSVLNDGKYFVGNFIHSEETRIFAKEVKGYKEISIFSLANKTPIFGESFVDQFSAKGTNYIFGFEGIDNIFECITSVELPLDDFQYIVFGHFINDHKYLGKYSNKFYVQHLNSQGEFDYIRLNDKVISTFLSLDSRSLVQYFYNCDRGDATLFVDLLTKNEYSEEEMLFINEFLQKVVEYISSESDIFEEQESLVKEIKEHAKTKSTRDWVQMRKQELKEAEERKMDLPLPPLRLGRSDY